MGLTDKSFLYQLQHCESHRAAFGTGESGEHDLAKKKFFGVCFVCIYLELCQGWVLVVGWGGYTLHRGQIYLSTLIAGANEVRQKSAGACK